MKVSNQFYLFSLLTKRELSGKYKSTVLGQLWSLANPIAIIAIYSFVFGLVFRIEPPAGTPSGIENFAIFLVIGLLPWLFFSNVVSQSALSLVANAALIQKVFFPRYLLPLSVSGSLLTNWGVEMVVLLTALAIVGSNYFPFLPLVLLFMVLLFIFSTGLGFLASIVNVYFRDFSYLLTIVLQFGFFLAPILYPKAFIDRLSNDLGGLGGTPVKLAFLYDLNPMVAFIDIFRALLYDNTLPELGSVLYAVACAVVAVTLGALAYSRTGKRLVEIL
jgi:lipopolysaccharide transport system permease protein